MKCGRNSTTEKSDTIRSERHTKNIAVKKFLGKDFFVISLYDEYWNFEQGTVIKAILSFSKENFIQLPFQGDAHLLEARLGTEGGNIAMFMTALFQFPALTIAFEDLKDAAWVISSEGAQEALKQFLLCASKM
jgi:hypothetical protein